MSLKSKPRSFDPSNLTTIDVMERDYRGYRAQPIGTRHHIALYMTCDANDAEVDGDGAANGTSVYSSTVAANSILYITKMSFIASAAAMMTIATGALGSLTTLDRRYLPGAGEITIVMDGVIPPLKIDNATGATALTWQCVVPQEFGDAATNNAATKMFHFSYSGITLTENANATP
jgi:hypothetical protein